MLSTVGRRAKKEVAPTRQHCYQAHPRSATNPALACVSELDPRLSLGSFTVTYVESGVNIFFYIILRVLVIKKQLRTATEDFSKPPGHLTDFTQPVHNRKLGFKL